MASFQGKIGWKIPRKREYKEYRSVSFLLDALQKISKKNSKNTIMASFQTKIGWKWMRNRENKNFHSVPTRREIGIPKKQQKNSKN